MTRGDVAGQSCGINPFGQRSRSYPQRFLASLKARFLKLSLQHSYSQDQYC
jgi:hypothetical protein